MLAYAAYDIGFEKHHNIAKLTFYRLMKYYSFSPYCDVASYVLELLPDITLGDGSKKSLLRVKFIQHMAFCCWIDRFEIVKRTGTIQLVLGLTVPRKIFALL